MMSESVHIRCSALPRVFACPASLAKPDVLIDGDSDPARLGRAVHAAIASWIGTGGTDADAVDAACDECGVDLAGRDDAHWLARNAWRFWASIAPHCAPPQLEFAVEAEGPNFRLTGTADLVTFRDDGDLVVYDWKSGRLEPDMLNQLKGYAWAAIQAIRPDDLPERFHLAVVWLRDNTRDMREFTLADIRQWATGLSEKVKDYQAGNAAYTDDVSWCHYCPLAATCEGRAALLQGAAAMFPAVADSKEIAPLTAEDIVRLTPQAAALEKALQAFKDARKAKLIELGGSVDCGDGSEIALVEAKRDTVRFAEAVPVLMEALALSHDETITLIADAVTVQKKALEDAVCKDAPRGQKSKAKAALMAMLREAGAIRTATFDSVRVRKSQKKEAQDG